MPSNVSSGPVHARLGRQAARSNIRSLTLLGLFLFAPLGHAAPVVNWATWTLPAYPTQYDLTGLTGSALVDLTPSSYAIEVSGTVVNPNNSTTVGLKVSGEISGYSSSNFSWSSYVPAAPDYVGSIPNSTRLAQTGYAASPYNTHTLTFDAPVTNVLMTIYSLGTPTDISALTFSQPFVILSSTSSPASYLETKNGYTLSGKEGHGLIQFLGTYSSIGWTVTTPEVFSAFNVGFTTTPYVAPSAVPTPPTLWLLAAGLLGIGAVRRKRVV